MLQWNPTAPKQVAGQQWSHRPRLHGFFVYPPLPAHHCHLRQLTTELGQNPALPLSLREAEGEV